MPENINDSQAQVDNLRAELNNLRSQLERIVKSADEKTRDVTSDMAHRIAREIEHCRHKAADRAAHLKDFSAAELNEVEEHVRQNPFASLLIAFGAGWVISCLFRHLR